MVIRKSSGFENPGQTVSEDKSVVLCEVLG